MVAARKGSMGLVRKMIQHGATVNLKNKVRNSCLVGPFLFVLDTVNTWAYVPPWAYLELELKF